MRIAISVKSGCGNTTVSKIVSVKLDLKHINYTFQIMAEDQGIDYYELCELAKTDDSYDIKCDNRQKELAKKGNCVVSSRLALWLIEDIDIGVYLYAEEKTRISRIHRREGGDISEVTSKTIHRDESDHNRYKKLYGIDIHEYKHADLVINTERFNPESIAEIIISAVNCIK